MQETSVRKIPFYPPNKVPLLYDRSDAKMYTMEFSKRQTMIWLLPILLPLLPAAFCLMMSLVIEPVFKALQHNYPDENADAWYNE